MPDPNPYAPPPMLAQTAPLQPAQFAPPQGLWRQDNLLVMPIGGQLPPKCVKSNVPTDQFLKRNMVWYPPWIALTIFIATPIYIVLALSLQKKATVFIGLTPEWKTKRLIRMLIAWGSVLLGAASFIAGLALLEGSLKSLSPVLLILAPVGLLTGIFVGLYGCRMVYPKKIDDRFIWLKGVCPAYLADLPPWTGPRA
jgi:hypothetical protein